MRRGLGSESASKPPSFMRGVAAKPSGGEEGGGTHSVTQGVGHEPLSSRDFNFYIFVGDDRIEDIIRVYQNMPEAYIRS